MGCDQTQVKDMIDLDAYFIRGIHGAAEPLLTITIPVDQPLLAHFLRQAQTQDHLAAVHPALRLGVHIDHQFLLSQEVLKRGQIVTLTAFAFDPTGKNAQQRHRQDTVVNDTDVPGWNPGQPILTDQLSQGGLARA